MITRFAPSPTGPLHLGHAYSALVCWEAAQKAGGTFLLRIEDFDSTRARATHEQQIYDDLTWLGLSWPTPRRQSDHLSDYTAALDTLADRNLVFPCSCTRRDVLAAGLGQGPDGPIYPGTCADRPMSDAQPTDAIRLNLAKAAQHLPREINYVDSATEQTIIPANLAKTIGAPVLRRINTGDPAYHLTCTHDDALQGITHVIRGEDVAPLTSIHVILQQLMGWPTPIYHHHPLIKDDAGKRLAKIDNSRSLASFRAEGATPDDIKALIGLL